MESKNMTEKEFQDFQRLLESELGTVDSEKEREITEMLRHEGAAHEAARPASRSVRELAMERAAAEQAAAQRRTVSVQEERNAAEEASLIEEMQKHEEPVPVQEEKPVPPVTRGKYEKIPDESEEPAPKKAEDFFKKPGKYEKVTDETEGYFNPELPKETASQRRKRVQRTNRIMRIAIGLAAVFAVSLAVGLIVNSCSAKKNIDNNKDVMSTNAATDADGNIVSTESESAAVCNILSITPVASFTSVLEGETVPLQIGMTTTGEAGAEDLLWESSDISVAEVSPEGIVSGIEAGQCTITISAKADPTVKAEIKCTVRHIEEKEGLTYIDDILVVNKTYSAPQDYNPGALTEDTQIAFDALCAAAAVDGLNIYLGSGYRSYDLQSTIFSNYTNLYGEEQADTFSARAGHSEHQTGMAIDVNTIDDAFGATPEAQWLKDHCHEYGFIIRYPEDKIDITGYKYEPWHIRYVGVEQAKDIVSTGLSLEEYLGIDSVYSEADDSQESTESLY